MMIPFLTGVDLIVIVTGGESIVFSMMNTNLGHALVKKNRLQHQRNPIAYEVLFSGMSAPVSKVLYHSPQFKVSLYTLAEGDALKLSSVSAKKRQFISTADGLTLSTSKRNQSLKAGEVVSLENDGNVEFSSTVKGSTNLLEVTTGDSIEGKPVALPPVTETRPWGSFTVLADEPDFKLKQLMVKPGNRLSYQRHQKREEHWFVIAGHPEVVLNGVQTPYSSGDYVSIPLHSWHRLVNAQSNTTDVEIIELQLGSYFGEDDIERQDDDYGRQ